MNPPGSMEKASEHAWVTQEKVSRLRRWERYAKQGKGMATEKGTCKTREWWRAVDRRLREGWTGLAHKGHCLWIGELINKTGAESVSENSP